jgi:hypothetical protein
MSSGRSKARGSAVAAKKPAPSKRTFSAGAGVGALEGEKYSSFIAAWLIVIIKGENLEDAPSDMYAAAMATIAKLGDRRAQFRIEAWSGRSHLDGILTIWNPEQGGLDGPEARQLAQSLVDIYAAELGQRHYQLVPS